MPATMQNNDNDQIFLGFKHYWEYWMNPDGTIRHVSPACEQITGYTPDQFIDIRTGFTPKNSRL